MTYRAAVPVSALRAFESAARTGTLSAAAEELNVTHSAISRHVAKLESFIGAPLFEGSRNRPRLTDRGTQLAAQLTLAFDRVDEALRAVSRRDDDTLDIACLGTFAMRWLIPRLSEFSARFPRYQVRLTTDPKPHQSAADIQIDVLMPGAALTSDTSVLFEEMLGPVMAPGLARDQASQLHTRTRDNAWAVWESLAGRAELFVGQHVRIFDHYHLTIEAALNGLGAAVVPLHLVLGEVSSGRLIAPHGFVPSGYRYVLRRVRPRKKKIDDFTGWLHGAVRTASSTSPLTTWNSSPP